MSSLSTLVERVAETEHQRPPRLLLEERTSVVFRCCKRPSCSVPVLRALPSRP